MAVWSIDPPCFGRSCGRTAKKCRSGDSLLLNHPLPLSEIQGVPGHLDGGGVHHLAVDADRTAPGGAGLLVSLHHLPGPLYLSFGGREDLVYRLDLGRVDAPLAVEAQRAGDQAALAQALLVAVVGDGAVYDAQVRGAGGDDDAVHGVVEAVAGVRLVPLVHHADVSVGHAQARREVAGAEVEGRQALRGTGYTVHVDEAFSALYLGFELYLAHLQTDGAFHLGEQRGGDVEVFGTLDLGEHDRVQFGSGLLDDLDQVAVEGRPATPVELLESPDDLFAGTRLLAGGDGVLEVEEDRVGGGGEGFPRHLEVRGGDGQDGARRFHFLSIEQRLDGLAAQRGVEDLHRVGRRNAVAGLLEGGLDLEDAAGVGGNEHLRTGCQNIHRLALAELGCGLGLDHVVDTGGTAADLGLLYLPDLDARYPFQDLARLLADALRVPEVAGVVVGDRDGQRVPLGGGSDLGQKLRDVPDLLGESPGAVGVLGVVAQEVTVLLHRRAAPGGVDDDVVQVEPLEGVYGLPREVEGLLLAPGVGGESAAAPLALGRHHLAALGGEHPDRRGVDLGEEDLLHAAHEDADPPAPLAGRSGELGDRLLPRQPRHEGLHSPHACRETVHDAHRAQPLTDTEALVEAEWTGGEAQTVAVGEELEDHLPEGFVVGATLVAAFDLGPGGLDKLVVLHARRTCGNAGHAPETQVPVPYHRVVHRLLVEALVHQVDASSWRVHLLAEEYVGRAGRQAEAAVNALVYEVLVRRVMVVERRENVATALGPLSPHGLLERVGGGREGGLPHVLGAAGADGLGGCLFPVCPLVRAVAIRHTRHLPQTCRGSCRPGDRI